MYQLGSEDWRTQLVGLEERKANASRGSGVPDKRERQRTAMIDGSEGICLRVAGAGGS